MLIMLAFLQRIYTIASHPRYTENVGRTVPIGLPLLNDCVALVRSLISSHINAIPGIHHLHYRPSIGLIGGH